MVTNATFTPAITITDEDGRITGISFDWSESLVYVGRNGTEVNRAEFDEYSESGPGCVLLDQASVRERIEDAITALIKDLAS